MLRATLWKCCLGLVVVFALPWSGPHSTWRATGAPTAESYVDQAISLYNKGECAKAIDPLKKAIALDPRYARAHSWLGLCYVKLGRNQEAVAAFQKVIAIAPNSEDATRARQWLAKLQRDAPQTAQSPPKSVGTPVTSLPPPAAPLQTPAPTTPAAPPAIVPTAAGAPPRGHGSHALRGQFGDRPQWGLPALTRRN